MSQYLHLIHHSDMIFIYRIEFIDSLEFKFNLIESIYFYTFTLWVFSRIWCPFQNSKWWWWWWFLSFIQCDLIHKIQFIVYFTILVIFFFLIWLHSILLQPNFLVDKDYLIFGDGEKKKHSKIIHPMMIIIIENNSNESWWQI